MSEETGATQFMGVPAGGWCEPDTGLCHIDVDTIDETEDAEVSDEDGVTPDR